MRRHSEVPPERGWKFWGQRKYWNAICDKQENSVEFMVGWLSGTYDTERQTMFKEGNWAHDRNLWWSEHPLPYVEDSQHGISYSCHLPTWLTGAESSIRRMEVTLKLWAVTCRCQRESSTPSSLAVVYQQMEERLFTESAREAHTRFNPSKGIGDYCGRCCHHEERLPCRECFGN